MTELEIHEWIVKFTLVLTRVSAMILAFPLFGQRYLPRLVKAGVCLSLTLVWLPSVPSYHLVALNSGAWLIYLMNMTGEMMFGAFIGLMFGLLMLPARLAGSYLSQEMGFSLGQITDPGSNASSTELGAIFDSLGILLLLGLNVHHVALESLHASFQLGTFGPGFVEQALSSYVGGLCQMHEESLLVIAPLASCLFITLFAMAVMMRTWPQLNLFSFGIGVRLAVGFAGLFLLFPYLMSRLEWFLRSSRDVNQLFHY